MLLLYRESRIDYGFGAHIYIPLCFYFIDPRELSPPFKTGNLHSTMLLLYHAYALLVRRVHSDLHSTMLLLYPRTALFHVGSPIHLHSTMLLLYRTHSGVSKSYLLNLHSTMLLLYRFRCGKCKRRQRIYIPLCFYFIFRPCYVLSVVVNIYIPLCFYFIGTDVKADFCLKANLHSTMLLLYLYPVAEDAP